MTPSDRFCRTYKAETATQMECSGKEPPKPPKNLPKTSHPLHALRTATQQNPQNLQNPSSLHSTMMRPRLNSGLASVFAADPVAILDSRIASAAGPLVLRAT